MHLGALSSAITPKLERIEILSKVNHEQLTLKQILQRSIDENLDDFLSRNIKLSKKKRRLCNISKQKLSGDNQKPKIVAISSMDNLGKKDLPISIPIPVLDKSVVDVAMIGADAYCTTCKLKEAQVFALSLRDLEFQVAKEVRSKTDLKSIISEEYHDLLNIFLKKISDTLPAHQKYDHKIILE